MDLLDNLRFELGFNKRIRDTTDYVGIGGRLEKAVDVVLDLPLAVGRAIHRTLKQDY